MKNNYDRESLCESLFRNERPFWHIWSGENHPIIFTSKEDFQDAMSIIGITARLSPRISIITFELMSNHLHIVMTGRQEFVLQFLDLLKKFLGLHYRNTVDFSRFSFSYRELTSLPEVRAVIAYDNRNGYLVSPDESPYSYPWGANSYYYNPSAKILFELSSKRLTVQECRKLIHSHSSDKIDPLKTVSGYACPMDFCNIDKGERLYANASQYFYAISKSVESYRTIATELAEGIFLTDDEMYSLVCKIAYDNYQSKLGDLNNTSRVEVAKTMKFNYNASNKQIARILRIPQNIVDTLFPQIAKSLI